MTEKAPAEQVIREMIAAACPEASDQTVRETTAAVLEVGMHRAPTAEDAEVFRRRFAAALSGRKSVPSTRRARGARKQASEAARNRLAADLKRRYDAGASIRDLAELTGRSYRFVHRMLSEAGVECPRRGGPSRGKRAASADLESGQ